jgi:hypothetical protein
MKSKRNKEEKRIDSKRSLRIDNNSKNLIKVHQIKMMKSQKNMKMMIEFDKVINVNFVIV